ncbi:MAG: hypothetical protein CVU57_28835 [Deltaproteobacteria bacterium HGW-Deltaproteobacteria-15]|jgi:hypothetical protein|nr:MAG: hypothetical protein CVU57_28835 [Deltaproteobacteria bacterium HGW-Deltaproteobacteria-15]
MRASFVLGIGLILEALTLATPVHAANPGNLSVVLTEFTYDKGKYRIKFGVINKNTYDRRPTIAFKVLDGSRPLSCTRLTLNVPAGSDGSALQEITVDGPAANGEAKVEAMIFDGRNRDRAGPWLSDCPR